MNNFPSSLAFAGISILIIGLILFYRAYRGYPRNDDSSHAAAVMIKMFKSLLESKSKGWIYIYANNLSGEVSRIGNYFYLLNELIKDENVEILILIDEKPAVKFSTYNAFDLVTLHAAEDASKVKIKYIKEKIDGDLKKIFEANKVNADGKKYSSGHFAISSLNDFRFEFNSKKHLANYFINSTGVQTPKRVGKLVNQLKVVFEREWKKAHESPVECEEGSKRQKISTQIYQGVMSGMIKKGHL